MSPESFNELLEKYISSDLSQDERAVFASMLEKPEYRALLEKELEKAFMDDRYEGVNDSIRKTRINKLLLEKINTPSAPATIVHRIHFLQLGWVRIAAACILLLFAGSLFYFGNLKTLPPTNLTAKGSAPAEIAPGRSGAILTLADGSKIVLDSIQQQKLVRQGNTEIVLGADQVSYHPAVTAVAEMTYNTLNVPRGHQFQLVLPDGTKVWLNAASSLRYPTAFTGKNRKVEMSGEAYFEVAHDASKPFIVKKNNTETKVLGTHFNVNAYDDEASEDITLLEGSVGVTNGMKTVVLRPGQQARVNADDIEVADNVDTDQVVAWKDGKFQFGDDADIKSVMHQISNWYDVDIVYKGNVTKHIGGTIPRSVNLSQLLKLLQTTGVVRFNVEGRSVEVLPQ